MEPPSSLELSSTEFEYLVNQALERIKESIDRAEKAPAYEINKDVRIGSVKKKAEKHLMKLDEKVIPESGMPFKEILDLIFDDGLAYGLDFTSPGFISLLSGGGIPIVSIADMISSILMRFTGLWHMCPGIIKFESNALRWFCNVIGYKTGFGAFVSGGTMGNFYGILCARRKFFTEEEGFSRAVIYTSDQANYSIGKSAMMAGIPLANIRRIKADKHFQIDLRALRKAIKEDVEIGLKPFMILANAGTTNTGSIDPLTKLAQIASKYRLWLHVDAAYGGFFALTERGQKKLQGIELADSVAMNLHKSLFFPFGSGVFLVKRASTLSDTFSNRIEAPYLSSFDAEEELTKYPSFSDMSTELTRSPTGLRAWLAIKLYGAATFRQYLDEKLDLARDACEQIASVPHLKVTSWPVLGIFTFSYDSKNPEDTNELIKRVNSRGNVLLIPTTINQQQVVRVSILHFRTHQTTIDHLLSDLRLVVEEMSREPTVGRRIQQINHKTTY